MAPVASIAKQTAVSTVHTGARYSSVASTAVSDFQTS